MNAHRIVRLTLLFIFLAFNSCRSQDCNKLPQSFPSYSTAVKQVKAASFKIKESANTSGSSWIAAASFYSCNGVNGFMIIKAKGKEYIHSGVPVEVWRGFKSAESKGGYYNRNIKGQFQAQIQ